MRKFLSVAVLAAALLFAGNAGAQMKIGYIRIDNVVGMMPELSRDRINLDTIGAALAQQYVTDSVMPRVNYVQDELIKKQQEYLDSTKPKAVRDIILKEIQGYQEELGSADQAIQQIGQQIMQGKKEQFLQPFYEKANNAIQAVAKRKGYSHVMNTDVFLVAPEADNLFRPVMDELKIKLPEQEKPAAKPATKPATAPK
jgi:outer membrane protein